MKRVSFLIATLLSTLSFGQVVTDDLTWVPSGQFTTQTSPSFNFCDDSQVSYTISTTAAAGFQQAQNGATGIIMPANTSNATQTMPFNIAFSQEVCNVRIHFVDFDENVQNNNPITQAEEFLSGISPAFTNVVSTTGTLYAASGNTVATPFDGNNAFDNDNVSGWVEWDMTVAGLNFTLNRPAGGYGVIIDSIVFECCDTGCDCEAAIDMVSASQVTASGVQNAVLSIDTQGELVTSICIDMPYYESLVDDECLKCDNPNVESFGTFTAAGTINGVSGTLVDPFGLGHSRKVCYQFASPTAINTTVQLRMQFPPVLELTCCKNDVRYCYDVTVRKDDCTSCEYTVCSANAANNLNNVGEKKSNTGTSNVGNSSKNSYNDFTDEVSFTISPNPANKNVTVEVSDMNLANAELHIYDPMGKLLDKVEMNDKRKTLDVTNFESGTYVISILGDDTKMSRLLVIQ